MLKILHVTASANPAVGGPIEGIVQLNRALRASGHDSEVLCLDVAGQDWIKEMPLRVEAIGEGENSYRYTPQLVPWLKQHCGDYSLIVVNGIWQYSSFGTWRAAQSARFPYVVYPHGMLDPWFKRTYPLKHLKKAMYWPWAEYRSLRDARAVMFTCEEERVLAKQSFRRSHWNGVVINYGTNQPLGQALEQRDAFYAAYPHLRQKRLLLFLSRIHVKKGCDLLINAFASVAKQSPDLHLVMAGPDQTGWVAELQRLAGALNVEERISWTGMLTGDLKWGALHAAEAFVLPSHQENFGISVVEALACRCPVLISNKVNIWREIAADGGGLVADDSLEGVKSLLVQWLKLPETKQEEMRTNAIDCFRNRFELTTSASKLVEVFRSFAHKT